MMKLSEAYITHVHVQGFRSIQDVTVKLDDLTVLVGPNGSGKSVFLDTLSFLHDVLTSSPADAFKSRGGMDEVRSRIGASNQQLIIEVGLRSRQEAGFAGHYRLRLRPRPTLHAFTVEEEACEVFTGAERQRHSFVLKRGKIWTESTEKLRPELAWNRLALPLMSSLAPFASVYRALTAMYFYRVNTEAVAAYGEPEEGRRLAPNGGNTAAVLRRLRATDEPLYGKVINWLHLIVPTVHNVTTKTRSNLWTLVFEEEQAADQKPVIFEARSMSEGTLRVLAVLLAVYQEDPPTLIGLEEPETAIHPGAAEVLVDLLSEAALRSQILVTTHSRDLIDYFDVSTLRAVGRQDGYSVITPVNATQLAVIHDGLFNAGELHRIEGLQPEAKEAEVAYASA
ncbi:MAG: AAA family ATPase [Chloroflexota bacterium]|nr:AAA family ATPase [Chloroflexota bacterium]